MNSGLTLLLAFRSAWSRDSALSPPLWLWPGPRIWDGSICTVRSSPSWVRSGVWGSSLFSLYSNWWLTSCLQLLPATGAAGLSARIVTGALTGAALAVAGGAALGIGAVVGAIGAVVGAFGGYHARVGLVRGLRVPDFAIALPEDAIAMGWAYSLLRDSERFHSSKIASYSAAINHSLRHS